MFLVIGDSHTYQSFGRNVDTLLRKQPQAQVETVASWGTAPGGWFASSPELVPFFERTPEGKVTDLQRAATPILGDLLERYHPNVTVIALGANLFNAPKDWSADTVRQMAQTVSLAHSTCFWVGPPDSRERTGVEMAEVYGILRGASTPYCQFVDSRQWTHYPATGGDGLHYDYLGAEGLKQTAAWAQKVFEIVTQ